MSSSAAEKRKWQDRVDADRQYGPRGYFVQWDGKNRSAGDRQHKRRKRARW